MACAPAGRQYLREMVEYPRAGAGIARRGTARMALARRLGLPAILGYLAVGTLLGPFAFGFIDGSATTRLLAELGVVFLLFTLGLEFSWPRMVAMRREVFGLGFAQVAVTTAVVSVIAAAIGLAWPAAIVVGGAVSMSSTAIILQRRP